MWGYALQLSIPAEPIFSIDFTWLTLFVPLAISLGQLS